MIARRIVCKFRVERVISFKLRNWPVWQHRRFFACTTNGKSLTPASTTTSKPRSTSTAMAAADITARESRQLIMAIGGMIVWWRVSHTDTRWLPVCIWYMTVTINNACLWLSVAVCGCLWLSVAVCGCLWLSVAGCGCLWLSVAVCGVLDWLLV